MDPVDKGHFVWQVAEKQVGGATLSLSLSTLDLIDRSMVLFF